MPVPPPACPVSSPHRRLRPFLLALAIAGLAWDLSRPPASQWTAASTISAIHAYQHVLSPVGQRMGVRCRFTLSCSHYAEAVIKRDGLLKGGWRTVVRLGRCGPWTPAGTVDNP
jgi:uncharacterized protein